MTTDEADWRPPLTVALDWLYGAPGRGWRRIAPVVVAALGLAVAAALLGALLVTPRPDPWLACGRGGISGARLARPQRHHTDRVSPTLRPNVDQRRSVTERGYFSLSSVRWAQRGGSASRCPSGSFACPFRPLRPRAKSPTWARAMGVTSNCQEH